MAMFLTREQLVELTGYVKAFKQIEWLRKNGVTHFVNAYGRPVVQSDALSRRPSTGYTLGPVT